MIDWNEHKICSKLELKCYWVLDLTLLVLECQVLLSRSLIYIIIFKRSFDFKGVSKEALKDYKDYRRTTSKSTVLDTKVSVYIDR